jgi:hypothetical protein
MWLGFTFEFWIGTAIAVAASVISILVALKRRRGQIVASISNAANLLSGVARQIPNLRVLYQDQELDDELVWISGRVWNVGVQDVGPLAAPQLPVLRLEGGLSWREFSIGEVPKGITVEPKIVSKTEVQLYWDLLRPNESFPFWAVIKAKSRTAARQLTQGKCIVFVARIPNTDVCFGKDFVDSTDEAIRRVRGLFGNLIPLFLVSIFAIIASAFLWTVQVDVRPIESFGSLAIELVDHPGKQFSYYRLEGDKIHFVDPRLLVSEKEREGGRPRDLLVISADQAKVRSLHVTHEKAERDDFISRMLVDFTCVVGLMALIVGVPVIGKLSRAVAQYRHLTARPSWGDFLPSLKWLRKFLQP